MNAEISEHFHWRSFAVLCGFLLAGDGLAQTSAAPIFTQSPLREVRVDLTPEALDALRARPRHDVSGTLQIGDHIVTGVQVHLKGQTGSFRPVEDRPSLTLSLPVGHGITKLHLENSVEDPSLLHSWLGTELFRAAGIPTTTVSHARFSLNGRSLGLYLLREGYDDEFLRRGFGAEAGLLYEPAPGHDVGGRLSLKNDPPPGAVPRGAAALTALAGATRISNPTQRWAALEAALDTSRFATLLAGEILLAHRDGYALARNNFRIHWSPATDRVVFLPHGMDQLLVDADFPREPHLAGSLARAFLSTPEGRRRYQERWDQLAAEWMKPGELASRVNAKVTELGPYLTRSEAADLRREAADLLRRIERRSQEVNAQSAVPWPTPMEFISESVSLSGWRPMDAPEGGAMQEDSASAGTSRLRVTAGPITIASWQTHLLLPTGRYRFEGRAGGRGIQPLPFGRHQGAALRVSGDRPRSEAVTGDSEGIPLFVEFEVTAPEEGVRFQCEVRASAGVAWFETDSLRLIRRD